MTETEKQLEDSAKTYNAGQVEAGSQNRMTGLGEITFKPYLVAPRERDNGDPLYQVTACFPKKSAALKEIAKAAKALADTAFPKKRNINMGIKDGDKKLDALLAVADTDKEEETVLENYGHLKGTYFVNFTTKFDLNKNSDEPGIIDSGKGMLAASRVQGGSKVVVLLRMFTYDKGGTQGVSYGLQALQVVKLGTRVFTGGTPAGSVFEVRGPGVSLEGETAETEEKEAEPKETKRKAKATKKEAEADEPEAVEPEPEKEAEPEEAEGEGDDVEALFT